MIRREFKKMINHYRLNQDSFLDCLYKTKESFESKEVLTKNEKTTLQKIDEMLLMDNPDPADFFKFSENFLVDDYTKLYRQIKNNSTIENIRNNDAVEVYFYSLNPNKDEAKELGTALCIDKMTFKSRDYLNQYQMLYN